MRASKHGMSEGKYVVLYIYVAFQTVEIDKSAPQVQYTFITQRERVRQADVIYLDGWAFTHCNIV